MRVRVGPALLIAFLSGGCTPLPQRALVASEWLPSPSHDERRVSFVVLHHTGSDSVRHSLATLTTRSREVSAHYVVARDGVIWQLVDERRRAWHAGEAYWAGITDLNSASIGVELDNDGREPFSDAQIAALLGLLGDVVARHRIPAANILGHGDVAPGRKVDPSAQFPWVRLARHGFGAWCDAPDAEAAGDPVLLLQAFGYDVRNAQAAMAAFRRHFRGSDSAALDDTDLGLLRCLVRSKAAAQASSAPRAY